MEFNFCRLCPLIALTLSFYCVDFICHILISPVLLIQMFWSWDTMFFLSLTFICVSTLINRILKTETGMTISFWDHRHHHVKTCRNLSFSRSVERKLRMLLSVFRLPPNSQLFCWKLSIFYVYDQWQKTLLNCTLYSYPMEDVYRLLVCSFEKAGMPWL